MPASTASPSLQTQTPARSSRSRHADVATEPPHKKRKYIPGGPGGGGRFIDPEGREQEEPVTSPNTVVRVRTSRPRSERPSRRTTAVPRSAMSARSRRQRPERYVPSPSTPRPRYSNAAAAAAASQASDGYKPREERSWEDFHPDLDIDAGLLLFTADEVDGRVNKNPPKPDLAQALSHLSNDSKVFGDKNLDAAEGTENTTVVEEVKPVEVVSKRKPGRPPRRPESMLTGLGSPPAPRILPLPTHNPKERLNLPKPSFRQFNHFSKFEEDQRENKVNYVDRTMSHVGYQESDRFELPKNALLRWHEGSQIEDEADVGLRLESDGVTDSAPAAPVVGRVEYDMDEQDVAWLEDINEQRRREGVEPIKPAIFEITMTQIEKEYHALEKRIPKPQPRHAQTYRPRSSSQAAVNGDPNPGDEPDSKCAICDDGDCENANAIIFCDGCDLAVHQECYGVPFIPEGQWFCRKCKEIGRGTPTCIFCPNVDGAFKQTVTLRWSHLLCAIWIPEVTIANTTFMEPITDVDKVPKGRWKLNCYICNQKMGACIQCSNKNCYLAFHVTCARRSKLFLRMKSQHQGGIDTSALKAFCDKHVSPEWRRTHDTDTAIIEAKRWYRHAMKGRRWADSQSAALELGAPAMPDGGPDGEQAISEDTIAVTKRKRNQPVKQAWRLPSGAPVVPLVVFNSVDTSLTRFTVRKRKEFVEKAARYWTLKREARRGAALLKRLQVQLESFSTMEITRRSFAGMGAIGRPRLQRRIDFAELLQKDISHLTDLCSVIKERERLRLAEVELLKELVDTVYFPISPLLWPILQRAQKNDEKTLVFKEGFDELEQRLRERYYTSVSDFSRDLSQKIGEVLAASVNLGSTENADIAKIHNQLNEIRPGTAEHIALSHEQKELKKLAKRIVKAVKEPIEEAMKKEAELRGREHDEELRKLDSMGIFASAKRNDGEEEDINDDNGHMSSDVSVAGGPAADADSDAEMVDVNEKTDEAVIHLYIAGKAETIPVPNNNPTPASNSGSWSSITPEQNIQRASDKPTEPISPPMSTANSILPHTSGERDFLSHGGIPWYLEPFDPEGTTVHDERYTGRAVLRDMSEELSDMDEDTLTELAGNGPDSKGSASVSAAETTTSATTRSSTKRSAASRRNRRRVR